MNQLRLHQTLRRLLQERGITMRKLSQATEVPEATLSGYVNGAEPSKMQHVRTICRYFGVTMEELLYDEKTLDSRLSIGTSVWVRMTIEEVFPDTTSRFQ